MNTAATIPALVIQSVAIVVTLAIFAFTTLATKGDIRRVESRLDRIEQNHLDHLTRLHVRTKQSNP